MCVFRDAQRTRIGRGSCFEAVQADEWIRTGSTGKDEKQSIDMVLLTPVNACQYFQFAPIAVQGDC